MQNVKLWTTLIRVNFHIATGRMKQNWTFLKHHDTVLAQWTFNITKVKP